ncbi:unnamed protein product [Calicophoron daubneyi]|uniref:Membralin n=1 Tax=Calicophoron daubneyi TaxID=300641 RepID=A0AAV2T8M7_CALDB
MQPLGTHPISHGESPVDGHPRRPTDRPAPEVNPGPTTEQNSGQRAPRISLRANVFNARAQLFEAFFRRVATGYARVFPLTARRIVEFGFLLQAFFVLAVFIHLHLMFVRSPITCLDKLRHPTPDEATEEKARLELSVIPPLKRNHYAPGDPDSPREVWPRYGVLRVEVIRSPNPAYGLADSYAKEFYGSAIDFDDDTNENPAIDVENFDNSIAEMKDDPVDALANKRKAILQESRQLLMYIPQYIYSRIQDAFSRMAGVFIRKQTNPSMPTAVEQNQKPNFFIRALQYIGAGVSNFFSSIFQACKDMPNWFINFYGPMPTDDSYMIEYALEYGFLRLSPAMRKRLNITVKLVVLDPDRDACFGGFLSRFLMEEFLGYDDLLLGSIKHLAVSEGVKGHMANLVTGQHYRLVSSQMSRSSYFVAVFVMLLFTFCVSVLLRYSSHQLVVVIADILQVFEDNMAIGIPATPFMTVILALVAIETVMSEFFGDSFTAFYVILIVSICDHYEAVFCRTEISRRYWPRFFYLYHFAFYAYHYRFNGQFSSMALWVSWLFILHSMIFFFHHYELPNLLSEWDLRELLTHVGPGDQIIGRIRIHMRPSRSETQRNPTEVPEAETTRPEVQECLPAPEEQVAVGDEQAEDNSSMQLAPSCSSGALGGDTPNLAAHSESCVADNPKSITQPANVPSPETKEPEDIPVLDGNSHLDTSSTTCTSDTEANS